MKRDPSLIPFSHDHHQGLLFALRLSKGAKKKADWHLLKTFALEFWEIDLHHHFYEEERVLLPLMNSSSPSRKQFEDEHAHIRSVVQQISEKVDDSIYPLIEELAKAVEEHIRFEERILFPELEATLTAEQLSEVGVQLAGHQELCHTFKPEFWK